MISSASSAAAECRLRLSPPPATPFAVVPPSPGSSRDMAPLSLLSHGYPRESWRSQAALMLERQRHVVVLGIGAALLLVVLLLFVGTGVGGSSGGTRGILNSNVMLEEGKVIPDVLDAFPVEAEIDVVLGLRHLLNGANLPLELAQQSPSVIINTIPPGSPSSGRYLLLMVDPDAPSPNNPTAREWLHWIVTNIEPGDSVMDSETNTSSWKVVVPYNKPTPPMGTHRYVLVAFNEPENMQQVVAPESRANFSVRSFAAQYSLRMPVAAFYFSTAKPSQGS